MREFRRPRWILMSVGIVLFAAACVALGFWQLRRHSERQSENTVIESRLDREPLELAVLLSELERLGPDGFSGADLEYTPVSATGVFVEEGAVHVRSQVHNGQAGTHAIHAFELADGTAVLVNLGWYPLGHQPAPLSEVFDQPVTIAGVVRATQIRPAFGREEPAGELTEVARVDIARIQEQVALPLAGVWIQMSDPAPDSALPIASPLPDLDDGPHLSYAVQWFSFAAIAVVFYAALVRRELRRGTRRSGSPDPR